MSPGARGHHNTIIIPGHEGSLGQRRSVSRYQGSGAEIHFIMRLVIIVTLSLASTQAFKIDGGDGEKVCTLEKSATNGENCFYEPECQNVCKDVQSTVSVIQVLIVN